MTRTRVHNGLSMAMLTRLDRMALGKSDAPADTAMAQIVAQDFERFLDIVEAGGGGAEAMLFLKARDGGLVPMAGFDAEEFAKHYQLSQSSAVAEQDTEADLPPEEEAARMSVWYCDISQGYRTNFPPPEDFDGEEEGQFGDSGYERSLSEDEERIQMAMNAAADAPLREAGVNAREAWFSDDGADIAKAEIAEEAAAREARQHEREKAETLTNNQPGPKFCHPREGGGTWPDVELENRTGDVPEAPAMDSRPRGNDKDGLEGAAEEAEAKLETKSEAPKRLPPDDPTVRVIHCEPPFNYAAHGMIPPWAERIY